MNDEQIFPKDITPRDIRFESPTFIDPLTGLFNRYYLDQFLPQEIKKSALSGYPFALLMIDVDSFKKVNDDHGHLCGDRVLKQVSGIIRKTVRQTDMVIRYAGDEFIILLPGAGREKVLGLCDKILSGVRVVPFTGSKNQEFHLTLSMGYAIYPEDTREQVKLIDMADKALYLSKKRGRNRYSSANEVTMEDASSLIAMDSFPCPKFINQREGLDGIKALYDKVIESGLLQAAFISGPSGVGKSRILNEIATNFKDKGTFVRCDASLPHMRDPYYLFAKGIDAYIETMEADDPHLEDILSNVPREELSEMSLVIPSLRAVVKKPADLKTEDKKKRILLFKAFADLLTRPVSAPALLVIFDDIQWADEASIELLRHLIMQEKNARIFIICVFSDDASAAETDSAALRGLLKEIGQTDNVKNIKLENLSVKDTAGLIDAVFPGVGGSKRTVDLIYNATRGNPSFIEETLKLLIENGFIFYQGNSWQVKKEMTGKDIPASMEEIIKMRLRNLDEETKEMILQAAVIGQNFQLGVLKKMGDKNEGFVSELMDRARSMRLVDESGKMGKFNFINKDIQNILYGELSKNERDKLHYKIAQILASEHKDNLYDIAGEAAFHYDHALQQEKAGQFSKELLGMTTELFDPREVAEYIAQIAQDLLARKGKVAIELTKKTMSVASKFVVFFQGAIKKFRLYPPGSSVRESTLKQVLQYLNRIFTEAGSLIVTEVEKSLVINSRRVFSTDEHFSYAEDLLAIMMEHGIKTIAFKKGVTENELNSFINQLSEPAKDVVDKGGWAAVIKKESLEHVGIDEVRFVSVDEYAEEMQGAKKLEDLMFVEFLLGKADRMEINKEKIASDMARDPKKIACAMTDIAGIAAQDNTVDGAKAVTDALAKIESEILGESQKGRNNAEILTGVILALEPNLRNKVVRAFLTESGREEKKIKSDIAGAITDDFMISMIVDEYKNNMDNPLIVDEFMGDVLVSEKRRKEILAKLEPRLSGFGINRKELSFVVGQTAWEDLPMDRRIEMLLRLPEGYYSESVLSKINSVLEELDSAGKKEGLKNAISRFLIKAKKINDKARKELLGTIIDFVKEPFAGREEGRFQKTGRIDAILDRLEDETHPVIFTYLLEITKQIINDFLDSLIDPKDVIIKTKKPVARKILFINQLFHSLLKRLKPEEDRNSQICGLIKDFISEISSGPFLEILAYSIIDDTAKNKYDIQDIYFIVKDKFTDTLINLVTRNSLDLNDPFREFLVRKKLALLLVELKDVSLDRMKKILSEMEEDPPAPLVELVGYFKDEGLVDWIAPFAHHADPAMRLAAIRALGEIEAEKSIEILSKVLEEEQDGNIRNIANVRLQRLKKRIRP